MTRGWLIPLFLLGPLSLAFGPPTLVESDDVRLPLGAQGLARIQAGRPPEQLGQASLIMDLLSGTVVFQRNARQRVAPASLTKVMTAVVALERTKLDQEITIATEDQVEGSAIGLRPGDTLTVEQLLWGMLVSSGNDAAHVLARSIGGGSVTRFVEWMNDKARSLGMRDTHFSNPHGLDADGQYTSAYDMADLSRYALRHPLFARIVASRDQRVEASRTFLLQNTNQFLALSALSKGVTGVKTGFTEKAGDCLIASVDRDGRKVLVVIMGAKDRAASASALIEYAYSQFTWAGPPPMLASRLGQARDATVMVPLWDVPYLNVALRPAAGSPLPFGGPEALLAFSIGGRESGRIAVYGRTDRGSGAWLSSAFRSTSRPPG